MPTLHVHLTKKVSAAQKRALARRLTDAVCRAVDKKPDDVTIYLYAHTGGAHDMAFASVLQSDRKTSRR